MLDIIKKYKWFVATLALVIVVRLAIGFVSSWIESRDKQSYDKARSEYQQQLNSAEKTATEEKAKADDLLSQREGLQNEINEATGKLTDAQHAYELAKRRAEQAGKVVPGGPVDTGAAVSDGSLCERANSLGVTCP